MGRIVTLTTDFGSREGYVGAMKGVILGIDPSATIVDISHGIEPQNVAQAAFVLGSSYSYFPPGTVHLIVVDPGVGTARKAVLLDTASHCFLAPDNGTLSYVLEANPEHRAFALTNTRYWRQQVSRTFHGRDIFAPVAGHLSRGVAPKEFGEPLDSLFTLHLPRPERTGDVLAGEVIHVDTFGNLTTNFKESDLPPGRADVEVGSHTMPGLSESYAEGGDLLAIMGSSGYLEIAAPDGSAATRLGARVGQRVILRAWQP